MYRFRRNKFGNKKCEMDGFKFDSKKEATRYYELKLLERAGKIAELKLQHLFRFPVCYASGTNIKYRADFSYYDKRISVIKAPIDDKAFHTFLVLPQNPENEKYLFVVEDVKSKPTMTKDFKIKQGMMKYFYGIDIKIP